MNIPGVLSIAGSDSGGGAGIQADLKTMAAIGCHGMTAITAVTAQNTTGVHGVQTIDLNMVSGQVDAVFNDLPPVAVKVGMLASPEIVKLVAELMLKWKPRFLIVDPVLRATSGSTLGGDDTAKAIEQWLFPIATLVTPNLFETEVILGKPIHSLEDMKSAAHELIQKGVSAALVKGGHLDDSYQELIDVLAVTGDTGPEIIEFKHPRIHTTNTHGTGCTLSSAIASYLALNYSLKEAIQLAINYLQGALNASKDLNLGKGSGPLWHMFKK